MNYAKKINYKDKKKNPNVCNRLKAHVLDGSGLKFSSLEDDSNQANSILHITVKNDHLNHTITVLEIFISY